MRQSLRAGKISEDSIKQALLDSRGSLFIAARYLGCGTGELDRYIRSSEELQVYASQIKAVKSTAEYSAMSARQFEEELDQLTMAYKVDGLKVIHDIAMGDAANAADRKVKLDAAIALRGGETISRGGGELEGVLSELNKLYQNHAPRITQIRQTTVMVVDDRQEKVISDHPSYISNEST